MNPTNPFDRPEARSRRGGPVKAPLARERIVTEALNLLKREGLDGMSLRKVAAALETGPSSLYAYVGDLKGLQAFVLDRALAEVDLSGARRRDWKERLKAVLHSYISVLLETSGLAQLAMSTSAPGPNAMRILNALLALLGEGGIDRAAAAWAVDLLLLYGNGIALEQSQGHAPTVRGSLVAEAIASASAEEYPHVDAVRANLLAGTSAERFSWAVDVLLAGVLHTPAPGARQGRASKAQR